MSIIAARFADRGDIGDIVDIVDTANIVHILTPLTALKSVHTVDVVSSVNVSTMPTMLPTHPIVRNKPALTPALSTSGGISLYFGNSPGSTFEAAKFRLLVKVQIRKGEETSVRISNAWND